MREDRTPFAVSSFLVLSITPLIWGAQEHKPESVKIGPASLAECIPVPVSRLLEWPGSSVLAGPNLVDQNSVEATWPKEQCSDWLQKVVAPDWLPPASAKPVLIRAEFEGRDTVRMAWERNGYSIQVSQTASIFAMKLTPTERKDMGTDFSGKTQNARSLCVQVFAKKGFRWGVSPGSRVPIDDLSQKIAAYSFQPGLTRDLPNAHAACGRPQTIHEAGATRPQNETEALRERDPGNQEWDKTAVAFRYWFRMISWYNDGKSVGFYFLKVEEGAWEPSYNPNIDKGFFKR